MIHVFEDYSSVIHDCSLQFSCDDERNSVFPVKIHSLLLFEVTY